MKKLILSVIVSLFMSVAFASSKEFDPIRKLSQTSKDLSQLLNSDFAFEELNKEISVKVFIVFNKKNEILVLNTDTENVELNTYIKDRLNYKKIASSELSINKEYSFVVKFIPYEL
jgi:hypothetical protein